MSRTRMGTLAQGLALLALSVIPTRADTPSSSATFNNVLNALQSGREVTVLTDLAKCQDMQGGGAGPAIQGGLRLKAFIVVPNKGLLFSDVHKTLDPEDHEVTEYIRYDLAPEGKLTVTVERMTAAGVTKTPPLVCTIPDGARFVW